MSSNERARQNQTSDAESQGCVIPEVVGRSTVSARIGCDRGFGPLPAWVQTYAEEGSESRLDRRSTAQRRDPDPCCAASDVSMLASVPVSRWVVEEAPSAGCRRVGVHVVVLVLVLS